MQNPTRSFDFNRALAGWWWLLNRDAGRLLPFAVVWAVVTIALLFIDEMAGFTRGFGLMSTTYLVDPLFVGALFMVALSDDLVSPMTMFGEASRRYVELLIISVLATIGIGLALLMLILPGIALMIFWCLAVPVLLIERKNPVESLGASFSYVRGHFWHVLGAFLVLGVILIVMAVILVLLGFSSEDMSLVPRLLSSSIVDTIMTVMGIYLSSAIYRELVFTGGHDVSAFD